MLLGCCEKLLIWSPASLQIRVLLRARPFPFPNSLIRHMKALCAPHTIMNLAVSFAFLVYLSVANGTPVLRLGPLSFNIPKYERTQCNILAVLIKRVPPSSQYDFASWKDNTLIAPAIFINDNVIVVACFPVKWTQI